MENVSRETFFVMFMHILVETVVCIYWNKKKNSYKSIASKI